MTRAMTHERARDAAYQAFADKQLERIPQGLIDVMPAIDAAIAAYLAAIGKDDGLVGRLKEDAWPELLPCTVEFGNVTVGRGCKTETLRLALMRAVDHAKRTPTDAEPSKGEGCGKSV